MGSPSWERPLTRRRRGVRYRRLLLRSEIGPALQFRVRRGLGASVRASWAAWSTTGVAPSRRGEPRYPCWMTGEFESRWMVVANVIQLRRHGECGRIRKGVKRYRAGTKVYVLGAFQGMAQNVSVVGLGRRGRWTITIVPVWQLCRFRSQRVYKPRVLGVWDEAGWLPGDGEEAAVGWARRLEEWRRLEHERCVSSGACWRVVQE